MTAAAATAAPSPTTARATATMNRQALMDDPAVSSLYSFRPTLRASPLDIDPIASQALMVTMDDLRDARVDTGVPTKADAHAVFDPTGKKKNEAKRDAGWDLLWWWVQGREQT